MNTHANPHANPLATVASQAAVTAAFAAAAQQVAAHAQIQPNGNQNTPKTNAFLANNAQTQQMVENTTTHMQSMPHHTNQNGLPPTSFTPVMSTAAEPSQGQPVPQSNNMPQPFHNQQQQLAISAQAQAAAILAAGGINPALLFNTGTAAPQQTQATAALTAAQVVASLIQPQNQAPANPVQLQEQKPPQHQQAQVQHVNHLNPPQSSPQTQTYNPQNHTMAANANMNNPNTFTIPTQPQNRASKPSTVLLHGSNLNHQAPQRPAPKTGLYAAAAAAASNPILLAQMQNWKLDQLEAHVQLLRDANQPVPQPVSLLLAEARRREEKRTAKRVANRKSACTSRARKKALVEEMTRTNAKLRRQAMILALLPDLVITIKVGGEITFCSAQVERVLRHKVGDMVGANISQLLIPSCREALAKLVEKLLAAEQAALDNNNKQQVDESNGSQNSAGNASAAIVSEQSEQGFPLAVVKVNSHNPAVTGDVSDSSGSGNNRAPTPEERAKGRCNRGDDSSSTVTKQLRKANEALDSNVRRHNAQLLSKTGSHKDDVTGASVTANNAGARLSSLQHNVVETLEDNSCSTSIDSLFAGVEDKRVKSRISTAANGNTSDDSGYRESGESDPSREDTSSSTSDTSNGGSRPRPLAPTCNVTLIRNDLSTILCEVTSSIRTRCLSDERCDSALLPSGASGQSPVEKSSSFVKDKKENSNLKSDNVFEGTNRGDLKELLLCLRPIRDGEETVQEAFRFIPRNSSGLATKVSGEGNSSEIIAEVNAAPARTCDAGKVVFGGSTFISPKSSKSRPMKKRPHSSGVGVSNTSTGEPGTQKMRTNSSMDAEKSVVESLMLMSSHRK